MLPFCSVGCGCHCSCLLVRSRRARCPAVVVNVGTLVVLSVVVVVEAVLAAHLLGCRSFNSDFGFLFVAELAIILLPLFARSRILLLAASDFPSLSRVVFARAPGSCSTESVLVIRWIDLTSIGVLVNFAWGPLVAFRGQAAVRRIWFFVLEVCHYLRGRREFVITTVLNVVIVVAKFFNDSVCFVG